MTALLLKNCYHIWPCADAPALSNEDILVEDGRIARIGRDLDAAGSFEGRVIDCSSHVVLPGLVNTHHHFYQTLTRNIPAVQNAKLFDWLVYLYEIWKYIDEEAIYFSSLLAMGELLKTGCTLTTDHHYLYPKDSSCDIMATQFKAADLLGMRFSPCRGSMSLSRKDGGLPPDSVVQTDEEILQDSERVIDRFHDASDFSARRIILAPCSPFSVSRELMRQTVELARKRGVYLHTHLAETEDENSYCLEKYGRRPLGLLEECGFLGSDVSYAHGIFFSDEELRLLQQTGTQIAHCPTSNMRLGSGICRVKEMRDLGINVAIAVDGAASNDSSDMLGEARNTLLLQRVKYGASSITAADVLSMATKNGARLLNFARVGEIRPGYAADLAVFNVGKMEYAGALSDPVAALVFSGYNHGTDYTVVAGKIAVDKGRLTGFDEEKLAAEANKISQTLIKKHGDR
jgi:8-oxoguanine deaminase